MKAYELQSVGNLVYCDTDIPECRPDWCVIKVKAAGICSSDIPRIFTKGTYHFPTIPGHELSGIVDKVANEKDSFLVGQRVGVFPLIPCRQCEFCYRGEYELCVDYDYIGSRRNGGFAEYVEVPTWNLIELSDGISFVEAAMMEPLAVSLHAVKKMDLKKIHNVAIVGTGMIAFAAAQWAVSLGVKSVSVVGRSEDKKKIADLIGGIDYTTHQNPLYEYDAVLEAVGSSDAINNAINLVKPGGTVVLMGNPEGDIALSQDTYWKILRKQIVVKGTWNSSYEKGKPCDWEEVKDALDQRRIKTEGLVSHLFSQNDLPKALKIMRQHAEPYCKIMTTWNEE